jgi:hypothetical protein
LFSHSLSLSTLASLLFFPFPPSGPKLLSMLNEVSDRDQKLKNNLMANKVLFVFYIGKRIALQQWSNNGASSHTAGSLQLQSFMDYYPHEIS